MIFQDLIFNYEPWYHIFIMSSLFVYSQYKMFDFFLKNYNIKYNILKSNIQDYIVSNISKSMILLLICIASSQLIFLLFNDNWPKIAWVNTTAIYISTDFVSLLAVRKHKINTLIHHIFSCINGYYGNTFY